jgi:hypothetical protein
MAPSVALPNWQRRTNVWRRVTSPARGAKRLRSGTLRTALNRGIVRKVKRGLYRWHR